MTGARCCNCTSFTRTQTSSGFSASSDIAYANIIPEITTCCGVLCYISLLFLSILVFYDKHGGHTENILKFIKPDTATEDDWWTATVCTLVCREITILITLSRPGRCSILDPTAKLEQREPDLQISQL